MILPLMPVYPCEFEEWPCCISHTKNLCGPHFADNNRIYLEQGEWYRSCFYDWNPDKKEWVHS